MQSTFNSVMNALRQKRSAINALRETIIALGVLEDTLPFEVQVVIIRSIILKRIKFKIESEEVPPSEESPSFFKRAAEFVETLCSDPEFNLSRDVSFKQMKSEIIKDKNLLSEIFLSTHRRKMPNDFLSKEHYDEENLIEWFIKEKKQDSLTRSYMYISELHWDDPSKSPKFNLAVICNQPISTIEALQKERDYIRADWHKIYGVNQHTTFESACYYGHFVIVKYLMEKGLQSKMALHFAAKGGHLDVVKYLIEQKDFPVEEADGLSTPLYVASQSCHLEIVKYLVEKGAKMSPRITSAALGFRYSREYDCSHKHLEIINFFLQQGTGIIYSDFYEYNGNQKRDLLWDVIYTGNVTLLRNLIVIKAICLNVPNENGEIPILWAAKNKQTELLESLIEGGADINEQNREKETLFWYAVKSGQLNLIVYLVKVGVKLDQQFTNDATAFWVAAIYKHYDVMRFLAKHGVRLVNSNNNTLKDLKHFEANVLELTASHRIKDCVKLKDVNTNTTKLDYIEINFSRILSLETLHQVMLYDVGDPEKASAIYELLNFIYDNLDKPFDNHFYEWGESENKKYDKKNIDIIKNHRILFTKAIQEINKQYQRFFSEDSKKEEVNKKTDTLVFLEELLENSKKLAKEEDKKESKLEVRSTPW